MRDNAGQVREAQVPSPSRMPSCRLVILAVLLFTLCLVSSPSAQPPLTVEWKEARLSVIAEKTPLTRILREVARQTGLEVRDLGGLEETISIRFSSLPLGEGLRKLLADVDYVLVEETSPERGTRPALALIFGRRATLPSTSRTAERAKLGGDAAAEKEPGDRLAALYAFAEQGDGEALRAAASDPDPTLQASALDLLAHQDPGEAATLAAAASRDTNLARRLIGLQALGQLDDPLAMQTLGEALTDGDLGVREYAVRGLMGQTASYVALLLTQALQDPAPSIRVLALEALASRGAESGEALNSALNTVDPLVRSRASELLKQMRVDTETASAEGTEETAGE